MNDSENVWDGDFDEIKNMYYPTAHYVIVELDPEYSYNDE